MTLKNAILMYSVIFNAMRPSNMKRKSRQKLHLIKKFSIMSSFISELLNFSMITCYNNSISSQVFLVNAHQMSSLGPGFSDVGELYLLLEFWVYCNGGFSTDY